jgi:hypothetical protein
MHIPGPRELRAALCRFAVVSERSEACRKKALACERAATLASYPNASHVYLDVARQWRDRAEKAEALERRLPENRQKGVMRDGKSQSY